MTNSLAHQGEVTSCRSCSASISDCPRRSRVDAITGDLSIDSETKLNNDVLPDTQACLSNLITPTTQTTTLEPDSDRVSDEGICPAASLVYTSGLSPGRESDTGDWIYAGYCGPGKKTMPGQDVVHDTAKRNLTVEVIVDSSNDATSVCCLSASNSTSCASHENRDARDSDAGRVLVSTGSPALVHTCGSQQSARISADLIDECSDDIARSNVTLTHYQQDSCSIVLQSASSKNLGVNIGMVTIAEHLVTPAEPELSTVCERGDLVSTVLQVAPECIQIMPEASGASSSHASIMHSDDENVKECEKGRCEVLFRDLEAGLPIDITSFMDEEEMHGVDLAEDYKCPSLVEATKEAETGESYDHDPASCDVKDLVDSELREPLLAHVQTDDAKSSQDKEILLGGENKVIGDSLEKEAEVHGLRKRRGAKADAVKPSGGDSGPGKMPEEQKKGVSTIRTKDASTDVNQDAKQKPVDKKSGKHGKSIAKPSAVKKSGDPQPMEELRAKEEAAETNRKVHESLDNFIRQTIRCEPYMNFTSRPGDKPLQRLRPDVFENHVAGKFARGFKVDNGSDPRDIATEENRGMDSNSNDLDGLKDGSAGSAKGIAGLGRGAQHSLKVPPGVVAFTQAAAKGTDLQGWLSPSKTKCEKCTREFCSTLNYRRHVRVHRRSLNPEKEDLSKERSKVAAFWDKLTPEETGSIVHYDNMEIEDLSGQSALDALKVFIHQPGLPSLPQGILKAGSLLLDIVQNKSSVPLSSERLLAILDDASEKTFLCGGTSIAVQRFVFNGEAGKVGLEEKNLVASMGFHIELKLVKAWMADKEAEALRCQQALFKEEEAAQQKRKKLLEKKRMKKIRQKERKGTTSQLVLQELENESIDDEGTGQGIGEEDDSPTGTGSSSSSLASVQDLAFPESAELDDKDALSPTDLRDDLELVLGEKSDTGKTMSSDEDQLHRSGDGLPQYRRERQQAGIHRSEDSYRKEDHSLIEVGGNSQWRPAEGDWDGDYDSKAAHLSYQSRGGRTGEGQSNLYYRKGEQDRIGPDVKRRDFERHPQERRPMRITRDRPRNDYSEQKPLRDTRGFEPRYGDGHLTAFKPLRKSNAYFMKGDSGNTDLSSMSKLQQYRSKPPGMNRASSTPGNGQVVWTRKVTQPAAVEATKDRQEETIHTDAEISKVDSWAASDMLPEVAASSMPDSTGGDVAPKLEEKRIDTKDEDAATRLEEKSMEKKELEDAATTVPLDGSPEKDSILARSGDDMISAEEMMAKDDEGLSGALLVGSLSVPLGKFASVSMSQARLGSNASYLHHLGDSQVGSVCAAGSRDESHGLISSHEVDLSSHIPSATGNTDGSEPLRTLGSGSNPLLTLPLKLKPHASSSSPERGDSAQRNVVPLGHERLAIKPVSWQTSAGRYVPAKVWRAVGVVGERQDLGACGETSSSFVEARLSQDVDSPGRSEGEREASPNAEGIRTQVHEFVREGSREGRDLNDDHPVVIISYTCKTGATISNLSASSAPFRPAGSEPGLLSDAKADYISKAHIDNGVEANISAPELESLAVYVGVVESFFNERWREALADASVDEVLFIPTDSVSEEGEAFNFLDMVLRQMSKESVRHSPDADAPSSSVVTELSDMPTQDGGVLLSKIFSDSDQTGVEDLRCSTIDEQGLDRASPQTPSSDDDGGFKDASTSPLGSEHYMSGSEMTSSAPTAGRESFSESGGGGGIGSYPPRRGTGRQERWYRNSRDRFSEQRYMARRRAPVEKNS